MGDSGTATGSSYESKRDLTPPSFGPPSIPYVPPITLEEAILRARVKIRQREKRGGKYVAGAVAFLILPLLATLVPLFPSDTNAPPASWSDLGALALVAVAFVLEVFGALRILTDRPTAAWAVLAGGIGVATYYAYVVWTRVLPESAGGLGSMLVPLIVPVAAFVSSALAFLGGAIARPRPVATYVTD